MNEPNVYKVEEAAARLRISRGAAYEGCRTGEIPSVRVGRSIRIPRAALDRLLANGNGSEEGPHGPDPK